MKTSLDAPSIDMDRQLCVGETPFQEGVRNAEPTQYLHRPWLHRECRRPWPGLGSLLDDSDFGAHEP